MSRGRILGSRAVGLDIGSHSIKAVELRRTGRGIILTKWAIAKVGGVVGVESAVQQLLQQQHLSRRPLALAVPGGMAFVRIVKPIISGRLSLEQAMRFEAQHVVPFPLQEVVWDYHQFDPQQRPPMALLVAVKRDLVEQRMRAAGATRATSTIMDLGPLAVYNAMRTAYPRALAPGHAILHLGMQTADLVLVGRRQFWVRSVPLGGERLTEAIMQQLHISAEQAERIKLRQEAGEADPATLTAAMAPVLEELAGEITRSIEYFQQQESEQGGAQAVAAGTALALSHVWLTGGSARLEGLGGYLQERLGCPVQLANPCQTITMACATPPPNPEAYSAAIGLALRALAPQTVEINLLREMALHEHELGERRLFLMAGGVCAVTALIVLGSFLKTTYRTKRAQLDRIDQALDTYQQFHPKIKRVLEDQARLERRIRAVRTLMTQRARWLGLLREIRTLMPSGVWLIEFVSSPTGATAGRAPGSATVVDTTPGGAPSTGGAARGGASVGEPAAAKTDAATDAGPAEGRRRRKRKETGAAAEETAASESKTAATAAPPALRELYLAGHALSFQGVNEFVAHLKSHPAFVEVRPLSSSIVKGAAGGEELVAFALEVTLADGKADEKGGR